MITITGAGGWLSVLLYAALLVFMTWGAYRHGRETERYEQKWDRFDREHGIGKYAEREAAPDA